MKISTVRAIAMSDPIPPEKRHRTDIGTKVKTDAVLILVEADNGLTGMGASLGNPAVVMQQKCVPWGVMVFVEKYHSLCTRSSTGYWTGCRTDDRRA